MSESTDDVQRAASPEVVTTAAEPPLPAEPPLADADDVEVLAQQPAEDLAPRHDSVVPTSRKLAPPPKPKRDSANPGSMPPSSGEAVGNVGSLRAPAAPSISYQDASAASREAVAAALSSSDSLRVIGEALSGDAGAFNVTEAPTGGRPAVPRPRSSPSLSLEKETPEEAPASAPPKSAAIFAQRIISVGTPSERPAPKPPSPSRPDIDLDSTLQSEERPALASPVAQRVETAQPPLVSSVPPAPSPSPLPPEPPVVMPSVEMYPPPPPAPPEPEPEPSVSVDIHVEEGPAELTGADIPITTDFDEEETTAPHASEAPLERPAESAEAPPAALATEAAPLAPEDVAPAAEGAGALVERLPVEELSREDSPSIPPDEPAPAMPPPVPAREAKPPPPPRRAPAPPREELTSPDVEKKKASKQKRAWWEELFSEDFVRANWKVSDEQIKREVTFVEESLGVAPGGVVLDLGCGAGQHAVELASRGYGVVGYDLSLYQLALAADIAQERSQKINFLQGDMREMAFEEMFDGIFCWNTSFGYFEEDKNFSVAERAFRALRPGGMFLVDVMNRDFVAAHTPSSVWFEGDACVCMDDAVIDYYTSRLRVKRSVILDDGRTRECTYSVRLYSFHELGKLLHEVGFRVTEVSGHPATPGVFLGQASPRILMLAQRP
jgi:SAM-dependent methyltransferase